MTFLCVLKYLPCKGFSAVQHGTLLQMRTPFGSFVHLQDGMAQRPEAIAAAVGLSAREVSAVFGAVLQQQQGNTSNDEALLRWLSQLLQQVCVEISDNRSKAGTILQMATSVHAHVTATYAITQGGYLLAKSCFCWQSTAPSAGNALHGAMIWLRYPLSQVGSVANRPGRAGCRVCRSYWLRYQQGRQQRAPECGEAPAVWQAYVVAADTSHAMCSTPIFLARDMTNDGQMGFSLTIARIGVITLPAELRIIVVRAARSCLLVDGLGNRFYCSVHFRTNGLKTISMLRC